MSNNSKSRAVGSDPGTAFFQTAEQVDSDRIDIKIIRNAFVKLETTDDIEDILEQNKWRYVKDGSDYYVIGEDSLRVAKLFPGKIELRRPMQDGVLNKNEEKNMLVMSELIKSSIGEAPDDKSVVCICISSESVDGSMDSDYHKNRLISMYKKLGWNVKVIEEGHAVVIAEKPSVIDEDGNEIPLSGIGISFGGGRVNCVLSYRGMKIVGMSVSRAGDWISQKVAEHLGVSVAQVTSKKEKLLDFTKLDEKDNIIYALNVYYEAMIEHVFKHFANKFKEVNSGIDVPLDVVIAGGTSMPKGFREKVVEVIGRLKLPFKIKDVKQSADPRNSVAKGCLRQAIATQKKIANSSKDDLSKILGD